MAQESDVESRLTRLEEENQELRLRIDAITGDMERFEFRDIMPAVGESRFGMGPAASKIYQKDQGFSFGGYGEAIYRGNSGSTASADFVRAIIYAGYKFNDQWVFNSEIEFEHASTSNSGNGSGSVSVEFAYLEYLHSDAFNVRAGMLLTPMGFLNELHEPTTFYGPSRPELERRILPSTWRENGVGVHGALGCFYYKLYAMNGFDATGFTEAGLRGGRQKGNRAKAEDIAVTGRLDWDVRPGTVVGVGGYVGDSGQGQTGIGSIDTRIFEVHGEHKWRGLRIRGLYAHAYVSDTRDLFNFSGADMTVVGKEMHGHYIEAGYDVIDFVDPESEQQVIPFYRYEAVNTHAKVASGLIKDRDQDETIHTIGVNWLPIPSIVFKASFQDFDRSNDRFEIGLGYVF